MDRPQEPQRTVIRSKKNVILNSFLDLWKGPRGKGQRFRNKFGMTRTEEVGMDRPQEPQRTVIRSKKMSS